MPYETKRIFTYKKRINEHLKAKEIFSDRAFNKTWYRLIIKRKTIIERKKRKKIFKATRGKTNTHTRAHTQTHRTFALAKLKYLKLPICASFPRPPGL